MRPNFKLCSMHYILCIQILIFTKFMLLNLKISSCMRANLKILTFLHPNLKIFTVISPNPKIYRLLCNMHQILKSALLWYLILFFSTLMRPKSWKSTFNPLLFIIINFDCDLNFSLWYIPILKSALICVQILIFSNSDFLILNLHCHKSTYWNIQFNVL